MYRCAATTAVSMPLFHCRSRHLLERCGMMLDGRGFSWHKSFAVTNLPRVTTPSIARTPPLRKPRPHSLLGQTHHTASSALLADPLSYPKHFSFKLIDRKRLALWTTSIVSPLGGGRFDPAQGFPSTGHLHARRLPPDRECECECESSEPQSWLVPVQRSTILLPSYLRPSSPF